MTLPIQVGPATITINRDDRFVVCQPDARIAADAEEGFFARDTRFVSAYDVFLNGRRPVLLNASSVEFYSGRFEFTNPELLDLDGVVPREHLELRIDRTVAGGVHEDYDIVNHARRPIRLTLEIAIESDFADIFDVRSRQLLRRGEINARWYRSKRELRTTYTNRDFMRELVLAPDRSDSPAQFANGRFVFVIKLNPKGVWHTCLRWLPLTHSKRRPSTLECNAITGSRPDQSLPRLRRVHLETPNHAVLRAWEQAQLDLDSLQLEDPTFERGVFIPAAGVPWYVTLFGRDSLVVSMQGISGYPQFAAGALRRLSALQATEDDPERDMEPGKIPHEIRHGELAQLKILPFQPYYGTHDATSLFLIVISYLYQWVGDHELLRRYLPNAEAALRWVDDFGDRDDDGFQEYQTRSRHGYYNQGWKDAGDAVPMADGTLASLPIALCELQGYVYDAKLRMADIYDLLDRPRRAAKLRREANELFERFNERFWWEAEGTYYLGLDGDKRPIESVASNAGHCLASGIVPPDRAKRVVERLLAGDMWSGWGIRTLSSDHPAYNPFSYHTGSVWPHDNAFIAGGFRRYGHDAEAATIAKAIFDASERFQANRLPELFAGLPRDVGGFPVQYLGASVPQAWAAGSIFRFIAILCGIHAASGAKGSRLYVNPALPDWLPELTIHNLRAGDGAAGLRFHGDQVDVLSNTTGFEIVHQQAPRPAPWERSGWTDPPPLTPPTGPARPSEATPRTPRRASAGR
ncbi:MAG TPA: glycogen debranching N-terminal domain-containing protein [Actinomycetota bacterium]|nr:glycogen debranching N-terminal domain-containing protein [Actinomycetota bacterium]